MTLKDTRSHLEIRTFVLLGEAGKVATRIGSVFAEPLCINSREGEMIIFDEDRASDSSFVERVWRCHSEGAAPFLSIAASRCELVASRLEGNVTMTVRGPETRATALGDCPGDGEWLGILLKLGTFLPHLPTRTLVDTGVNLPAVSRNSFQLFGSIWQLPDYDNADTFIDWLVRQGELAREPVVDAALQGHVENHSTSTIQRRFLWATGLTQGAVRQIERARYATQLLQQGVSILDTVEQAGYFDQPHLTRSLKSLIGQTPAQIREQSQPEQMPFLYKTTPFE
jgi:AraC-like DNA-binding protein